VTVRAAPKLGTERARAILQHAIESRAKGELFTTVMNSELEALSQELVDNRGAVGVMLNMTDAELAHVRAELLELVARVSKSSPKNDRVDAGKIVHAPGASRK